VLEAAFKNYFHMLFNSYSFIFLYLPITFAGMFILAKHSHRLAALWLALASLTFYAVWDVRFVMLLLGSIGFNYGAGYLIGLRREAGHAKQLLAGAIGINLALLAYFKYTNFFIALTNEAFGAHLPALNIILPLGISFFTFTQIAFLVDVYRGIAREANFIHYVLFVTWFPHLIAGPVLHHKQMMPQFAGPATYRINSEHVSVGLTIFVLGLAKKVLIADTLAEYATPIFNAARDGHVLMLFEAWTGALAYTLQLYFDFSGYSDMAIGLSLMFNIRLPLNFDSPYKATNIIEFWRRWHMTLSAFLRDYLYFTLGGNRKGSAHRYINLMATMLLGGLWHGAGWTFLVWGGLHGFYLMINHGWRAFKVRLGWGDGGGLAKLGAGALTFLAVVVAWVFFRADSLGTAGSILSGMAGLNGVSLPISMESRIASIMNHSQINLVFDGLLPHITQSKDRVVCTTLIACLTLVWMFPNTQQIVKNYDQLLSPKPCITMKTIVTQNRGIIRGFVFNFPHLSGILCGVLFAFCVLNFTKISEFLYFQF
jgi:D-alanyl-lipoteichoic acid acyltransferase DltB (MBOAT superfamily)